MRWVLSLWCVFLLSTGVLAQNTLRFIVKDGRTRLPLAGMRVTLPEGQATESQILTGRYGVAVAHGLAPGVLHFRVLGISGGILYPAKQGKVTIYDGQESKVCFTILPDPRGEIYEWNRVVMPRTSTWMTVAHEWSYLVSFDWPEKRLPLPGKLAFQVRDAVTGKPLPYVPVLLKGPEITEPVGE